MSDKLVNVRLDAGRLRKALALRRSGVTLSDVVREAIDARYASLRGPSRDTEAIITRLLNDHPDPDDLPPREYDVHDRRAARAAIRRRVVRHR